jgi:hypothetical protein
VSENRLLRRKFRFKREDSGLTGGWEKFYNEELHSIYSSPIIVIIIVIIIVVVVSKGF